MYLIVATIRRSLLQETLLKSIKELNGKRFKQMESLSTSSKRALKMDHLSFCFSIPQKCNNQPTLPNKSWLIPFPFFTYFLSSGFPETALLSWNRIIGPLSAAGYFVVAPDQRGLKTQKFRYRNYIHISNFLFVGYNTSEKPPHVSDYAIDVLSEDIFGLLKHYKKESCAVLGHDWYGISKSVKTVKRNVYIFFSFLNLPGVASSLGISLQDFSSEKKKKLIWRLLTCHKCHLNFAITLLQSKCIQNDYL